MKREQPQRHEIKLKKQIEVTVNGTVYRINHVYTGTKTVREMYESFLERKLKNS